MNAPAPAARPQPDCDPTFPPGWSYDPSSWSERLPLVGVAFVGLLIATYLSLYQWRVIPHAWDPFFASPDPRFRNGSEAILNSPVSRLLPVPDAFLGALGYAADVISGLVGGRGRWRTLPWVTLVFGVFVGPFATISILLVILQPVMFHAWCLLCLCSAAISVAMIGPAMDEVLASLQYLRRVHDAGRSVWRAFWGVADDRELAPDTPCAQPRAASGSTWPQIVGLLAGLWLMAAPAALGYVGTPAAANDYVVGPVAAAVAATALAEVVRGLRRLNVLVGLWLLLAPWLLHAPMRCLISDMVCGLLLVLSAAVPGRAAAAQFGGGWASLFRRSA